MGIQTKQHDGKYLISSDRGMKDAPVGRPPRGNPSDTYQFWTGEAWSLVQADAMTFNTLDEADEYVKANYPRLVDNSRRFP